VVIPLEAARPVAAPVAFDLQAPTQFDLEIPDVSHEVGEWSQGDGYREAAAWTPYPVSADDPRIEGTLTMSANIREFDPDQGPDQTTDPIYVMVGRVRIDNEAGAWVGTLEGSDNGGLVRLQGTGGYAGLRAVMAMGGLGGHGIILSADEPSMPDPPARPEAVGGATSPGDPSPSRAARVSMGLCDVREGEEVWTEAGTARQFSRPSIVATVCGGDPRIRGTLSWTVEGRYFESDEGDFWVAASAMRIDNEAGAWVGTADHLGGDLWADEWSSGQAVLVGEGAYEGLTALLAGQVFADRRPMVFLSFRPKWSDVEGVIFPGGLPPVPDLVGSS
jgi:hypothetical protein